MRNLLKLIFLSSILFASCIEVQTVKNVSKQITGTITDSVTQKPYAKSQFILQISEWKEKPREEIFSTDENGHFSHTFKTSTYSSLAIFNTTGRLQYWQYEIGNDKNMVIDAGEIKGTIFLHSNAKGVIISQRDNSAVKNTEFWITVESINDSTGQVDLFHYPFFTDSYGQFEKGLTVRVGSRVGICYPNQPSQQGGEDLAVIVPTSGPQLEFGPIKINPR